MATQIEACYCVTQHLKNRGELNDTLQLVLEGIDIDLLPITYESRFGGHGLCDW